MEATKQNGDANKSQLPIPSRDNRKFILGGATIALVSIGLLIASNITVFTIQPIGALPEGKTVIIKRLPNGQLFDSADAMCERTMGGVSLFCRMGALSIVLNDDNIYARFPYMAWAYKLSTDGREYDR